jgi:nucleotide-binding universal stress UspA family protein
MGTYRKILLATDFSDQARKAAAEAVRLARRDHAQLHVVYVEVVALQGAGTFADPPIPDYIHSMNQLVPGADLDLNYKDTVLKVVRDRSEAAGILRYAAEQAVDLVVVGTHGRGTVSEMILGSVAQAVVREAATSVLVVGAHAAATPATGAGCILAPVDFSLRSAAVLAEAGRLARQRDARLIALHVVDFGRVKSPEELGVGERERRARAELQEFASAAALPTDAETLVTAGPAAEEIVRIAAKFGAGLIVMAPSSHTTLERLMLGSVCRPVIRTAPCPVLVHRAAAGTTTHKAAA